MKFTSSVFSILAAFAYITVGTTNTNVAFAASLKGTNEAILRDDDMEHRQLVKNICREHSSDTQPLRNCTTTAPQFDFLNQPYGLRFGGDIASLNQPIVGIGRAVFKQGTKCTFNGFGNLNSTFIPVSDGDVGGMCNYTFDATLGQGSLDVFFPTLGPIAASSYEFILVKGGEKIFFVGKGNPVFVMIAEKQ